MPLLLKCLDFRAPAGPSSVNKSRKNPGNSGKVEKIPKKVHAMFQEGQSFLSRKTFGMLFSGIYLEVVPFFSVF